MDRPSQAYPDRPDGADVCQVKADRCLSQPAFRIYCRTEGIAIQACQPCYLHWQDRAHRFGLHDRCPRCAHLQVMHAVVRSAPPTVLLEGEAARVIDRAMHMEGILGDIRERVLARLQREAFWLAYARPENQHAVGFKGSG